jgi:HEAT repeat protein
MTPITAFCLGLLLQARGAGAADIAAQARGLKDRQEEARIAAAEVLGQLGPEAVAAVPTLAEALRDESGLVRVRAAGAILRIISDHRAAGPALVEALASPAADVRRAAIDAIAGVLDACSPPSKAGTRSPEEVREVLARFGPASARVVPALAAALEDRDPATRAAAAELLGALGAPARESAPALIAALGDREAAVRATVASALGQAGAGVRAVVPALLKALKDPDPGVRGGAEQSLRDRFRFARDPVGEDPDARDDVPALVAGLGDGDARVRAVAAYNLWQIGRPRAAAATPALAAALEDPNESVRLYAAAALVVQEPENRAALAALEGMIPRLLRETSKGPGRLYAPGIRFVAEVLGALGDKAEPAIPYLIRVGLRYPGASGEPTSAAEAALVKLGPVAVPALVEALKEEGQSPGSRPAVVLGRIGPGAAKAVPDLIELLRNRRAPLRQDAAWVLGQTGAAEAAGPALVAALEDPEPGVRIEAARALGVLGRDRESALPVLADLAEHAERKYRAPAIAALGYQGPAAIPVLTRALRSPAAATAYEALLRIDPTRKVAVAAMAALLRDKDDRVREEAAEVLGQIGPEAKGSIPALERALGDEVAPVRLRAAAALQAIEPGHRAALATLTGALQGGDTLERLTAASILGALGQNAREAIPALKAALKDREEPVRAAARDALEAIDPDAIPPELREKAPSGFR